MATIILFLSSQEVEDLAVELGMRLHRTSVKDDLNVEGVFAELAENYVAKVKALEALADFALPGTLGTHHSATANNLNTKQHIGGVGVNSRVYQEPTGYVPSLLLMQQNNYKNSLGNGNTTREQNSKNFVRELRSKASGSNNRESSRDRRSHHKQQQLQQQQQQQQHYSNNRSMLLGYNSHHNPIMIKPNNNIGSIGSMSNGSSFQQKFLKKSNNLEQQQQHRSFHSFNGSSNTSCHFSPTDYLNNPMFDTLHARRYWPSAGRDSGTITLRPLGNLAKKNVHKRIPLVNKNSCKVL